MCGGRRWTGRPSVWGESAEKKKALCEARSLPFHECILLHPCTITFTKMLKKGLKAAGSEELKQSESDESACDVWSKQ